MAELDDSGYITFMVDEDHGLVRVLDQQLAEHPWLGRPYAPRWSPEFCAAAFGDGGLITFVVSEPRRLVVLEQVIWVWPECWSGITAGSCRAIPARPGRQG